MSLPRLQQRTTPDNVADTLREAILDGTLKAGSQLRETHIAAELGISRAPLREALRRLEEEGLVAKIPFRGAFVAQISQRAIDEISELRSVLEPWAMERGLEALRTTRLGDLQAIIKELGAAAKSHDVQRSIDAHLAFHRTVYEAAGNEQLVNLWRGWESQLRLFLAEDLRAYEGPAVARDVHAHIVDLIQRGDLPGLLDEITHHIHAAGSPEELVQRA